ncbi:hypothetical protein BD410DRAFT_810670, partial [Rickenella mellea]
LASSSSEQASATTTQCFYVSQLLFQPSQPWSVIGTLALDITLDVTLCGMLSYVLLTERTKYPGARTDQIVNRIVQYVVGTGALSCACAITILICVLAIPNTLIYLTPLMLLEKFYVLSYLVLINSRHMLRRLNVKLQDTNMEMSALKFASKSSPSVGIGREALTPHRPHRQSNSEMELAILSTSWKLVRAITDIVDRLEQTREGARSLKYLETQAKTFLTTVTHGLAGVDTAPYRETIASLELLYEDILTTSEKYILDGKIKQMWKATKTRRNILNLNRRMRLFIDTYLLQVATETARLNLRAFAEPLPPLPQMSPSSERVMWK